MARETKRPLLAIALMLCATVAFVAMQAVVKACVRAACIPWR